MQTAPLAVELDVLTEGNFLESRSPSKATWRDFKSTMDSGGYAAIIRNHGVAAGFLMVSYEGDVILRVFDEHQQKGIGRKALQLMLELTPSHELMANVRRGSAGHRLAEPFIKSESEFSRDELRIHLSLWG